MSDRLYMVDRTVDACVGVSWFCYLTMENFQSVALTLSMLAGFCYYAIRAWGAWFDNIEKRRARREQAERKTE